MNFESTGFYPSLGEEMADRLRRVLGSEEEPIEKVRERIENEAEGRGDWHPGNPVNGPAGGIPFKNVIPSNMRTSCAKNLEVWMFDDAYRSQTIPRRKLGAVSPYETMDNRMLQAYEHIVNNCRGVTNLIVMRGNYWSVPLWQEKWGPLFQNVRDNAIDRVKKGSSCEEWKVLSGLVVIQKTYGVKYQPSSLLS